MPLTFSNFQQDGTPADNDFIVGYTSATPGGERAWSIPTIRKAITGQTTIAPIQVQVAASIQRATGARYTPGLWYNVRSVTNDSSERVTINFTNPLGSANYCVLANPVGGTDEALHREVRPEAKFFDRVTLYTDRGNKSVKVEPAFDVIVVQ